MLSFHDVKCKGNLNEWQTTNLNLNVLKINFNLFLFCNSAVVWRCFLDEKGSLKWNADSWCCFKTFFGVLKARFIHSFLEFK